MRFDDLWFSSSGDACSRSDLSRSGSVGASLPLSLSLNDVRRLAREEAACFSFFPRRKIDISGSSSSPLPGDEGSSSRRADIRRDLARSESLDASPSQSPSLSLSLNEVRRLTRDEEEEAACFCFFARCKIDIGGSDERSCREETPLAELRLSDDAVRETLSRERLADV